MGAAWDASQVEGLAPDAGSLAAGRKLAQAGAWSGDGATAQAVWGLAAGSGKNPYQVAVDLGGPAYTCSCPSRKIPCKHVLGLLLRWASGAVPDAAVPAGFVAEWLAARGERAEKAAVRATVAPSGTVRDPAAAARRAEQRAERVAAGLEELDRWVCDQVRTGLAAHRGDGYTRTDAVAARMVDAQAPGVATWLRRLPALAVEDDDGSLLLEQYALLRLLVTAHRRVDDLPPELAATVRSLVGYPISTEQVLARPAVADTWVCVAVRRKDEERLTVQRTWLRGAATGRWALLLAFAPAGAGLEVPVVQGTALDADLHFHPGARPLRAVLGERRAVSAVPPPLPPGGDVAAVLVEHAAALAVDPWTRSVPVRLDDVRVCVPDEESPVWALADPTGAALPLARPASPAWSLLAVGGGRPVDVVGTWSPGGLEPLAVRVGEGWQAA